VLRRILAEHHEVATAAGGAEALRLLAEREFDLLLCDVMMPGMNADELYRRILAQYPHLAPRIVFMSGGALGSDIQNALQALPNGRLAKPFTVEDVLNIVASFAQ
jgi:CheY-like chemotaxis protein